MTQRKAWERNKVWTQWFIYLVSTSAHIFSFFNIMIYLNKKYANMSNCNIIFNISMRFHGFRVWKRGEHGLMP